VPDGGILIADFGWSREAASDKPMTEGGTHIWGAPETDRGAMITRKANVFAMGTVPVEILLLETPSIPPLHGLFARYGPKKCQATQHQSSVHNMPAVIYVLGHLSQERGMGNSWALSFLTCKRPSDSLRNPWQLRSVRSPNLQTPVQRFRHRGKIQGTILKELVKEFDR
jgi:serine/threonine protein kinase